MENDINDFIAGDEVLCTPYIRNKHNQIVGLSRGRIVEVKTNGSKGPKVIVEIVKPDGSITQYTQPLNSRELLHYACGRALKHSEALRKAWQKTVNTSTDEREWVPLAQ